MTKSGLEKFANHKNNMLLGGGYTFNLEDQIAGLAAVQGYDDVNVHNVTKPTIKGGMKNTKSNKTKKAKKTTKRTKKTRKYTKARKSTK